MSEIIAEIKDRLIKQQEEKKAKACTLENEELDDEDISILKQAGIIEESIVHVDFSDLLMQDDNISEIPNFDEEDVQESIQRYRKHMKHLQETNDGLFKVNKGLERSCRICINIFWSCQKFPRKSLAGKELLTGTVQSWRRLLIIYNRKMKTCRKG